LAGAFGAGFAGALGAGFAGAFGAGFAGAFGAGFAGAFGAGFAGAFGADLAGTTLTEAFKTGFTATALAGTAFGTGFAATALGVLSPVFFATTFACFLLCLSAMSLSSLSMLFTY
jgi:hypothetical protein